jgi:hypothetical protein
MRNLFLGTLLLSSFLVACNKQQYSLPETTEQFSQNVTYNNKVDLVLMVDNSSSMSTYQNKLAAQAGGMLAALNSYGMDYHIVVVTTDMRAGGNGGIFVGSPKVLTNTTPNLSSVLSTRIQQGMLGSDLERGLLSIETALTHETGFLRDDALLAILSLSNEDDYSDGNTADYKAYFDKLKPKFNGVTQAWLVNFIGVPSLDSNCTTALDGIYKEPGLRWIDLANYSGGLSQPICDTTLASAVNNIRQRIVEVLTEFALGRKPVIGSIVVKVNGNAVPESTTNGWEYIPDGNRIRFHGTAVPGATDKIYIDFKPAEAT